MSVFVIQFSCGFHVDSEIFWLALQYRE